MKKKWLSILVLALFLILPTFANAQFSWNWSDRRDSEIGLAFQLGRVFEFGGYCASINKYLSKSEREKYGVFRETPMKYWPQLHQVYEKGYQNAKTAIKR